jgi:acetyl-CoA acyltransferase
VFAQDEHPRETSLEALAKLKGVVRAGWQRHRRQRLRRQRRRLRAADRQREAARQHGLTPRARIVGMATAGVAPRVMGIGPAPATQKLLRQPA